VYGISDTLEPIIAYYVEPSATECQIVIDFIDDASIPSISEQRKYKILSGFQRKGNVFVVPRQKSMLGANPIDALRTNLRSYLLYDSSITIQMPIKVGTFHGTTDTGFITTSTPVSGSNLLLPEEFPIILAFFHLSNVVRYAPDRLERLFDSQAAGMLETLIRQGSYRFLELFWNFMKKKTHLLR